jgi:predicted CxxxxCH...CXXCH cytochrome family protein
VTLASTAIAPIFNENNLTATYTSGTQVCTNVSCHGGQILYNTPVPPAPPFPLSQITWKGNELFNQTTCTKCHLALTQPSANVPPNTFMPTLAYIGPISGDPVTRIPPSTTLNLHALHGKVMNSGTYSTNPSLLCKACHRLTVDGQVDGHFSKIMNGRRHLQSVEVDIAAGTIGGSGTQISSYTRRPNPAGQSSCVADGIKSDSSGGACHSVNVTRSWYSN